MKISWQKALTLSLSLAAILMTVPVVSAHDNDSRGEHRQIHRDLGDIHEDFHQTPSSRREHRRFHKQLKREHRALDRELRDGRRYDDRYDYGSQSYSDPYR